MINIDNKFDIGQIVYLKTDPEQSARIVTAITISQTSLLYNLSLSSNDSRHYDFEISEEANVLQTLK